MIGSAEMEEKFQLCDWWSSWLQMVKTRSERASKWSSTKTISWKTERCLSADKSSLNPPGGECRKQIHLICGGKYPYSWWREREGRKRCLPVCNHVCAGRAIWLSADITASPGGRIGVDGVQLWTASCQAFCLSAELCIITKQAVRVLCLCDVGKEHEPSFKRSVIGFLNV